MNIEIRRLKDRTISSWSGGTTSELFIYPTESNYKKRDFDFRMSTATVEVESSDFTPLSEINRTLMVLDGEMSLTHTDHHSVLLKKFEQDNFEGGWETFSEGKCIDFNLMCRNGVNGSIEHIIATGDQYLIDNHYSIHLFYNYKGSSNFEWNDTVVSLNQGDVLVFHQSKEKFNLIITSNNSEIICCKINTDKGNHSLFSQ